MNFKIRFLALAIIILYSCSDKPSENIELNTDDKDSKINVYLLGTFHFAQTDSTYNVLNKKHQKSINDLNDIIVSLNPNKIFVERMPDYEYRNKLDSLYTNYTSENNEINNRGEIWQVGFKVAKRLGHKKIYQCDHPGRYGSLYAGIEEYAKANNQTDILDYKAKGITKPITSKVNTDSLRNSMSLLNYMKWLNSKDVQETSHAHYINVFPQVGHTNVYDYKKNYLLGTELTADWYRRNIYIYSKMINQLDYNEKSIFLIIGNDHIPIIKQLFEDNPYFNVKETQKWLN